MVVPRHRHVRSELAGAVGSNRTVESVVRAPPAMVPRGPQSKPAYELLAADAPLASGTSKRPARRRLDDSRTIDRRMTGPLQAGDDDKLRREGSSPGHRLAPRRTFGLGRLKPDGQTMTARPCS